MSFEEKFIPPANSEPKKESLGINVESILEGHALEEIAQFGWGKYREVLKQSSYVDIISRQAKQIEEIESKQDLKTASLPEWVINSKNTEAGTHAIKLSQSLTTKYGKDTPLPLVAFQDRGKKLTVQGREKMTDGKDSPIDNHLTRIYFTVPTSNSPEAYKTLVDAFVAEGIMGKIQLSLNLENYTADSLGRSFENNTIIAYVYGSDPSLMTKVAKAITTAKHESKTDLWKLEPKDLAQAKTNIIKDFMIPLDDTTSFVEAKNLGSYHAGPRGRMFNEITGELPTARMSVPELEQKFKGWNSQCPGLFSQEPERRRFMPALVF